MKAGWRRRRLTFIKPATTSRGALRERDCWFLRLDDGRSGLAIGEAAPLPGLSVDDRGDFEDRLDQLCSEITRNPEQGVDASAFPSLAFALETARRGMVRGSGPLFPSPFTDGREGIPINGLIWMASRRDMQGQIRDKLAQGFRCIKIKIGALDFEEELALLHALRRIASARELEIRVDANGAFAASRALERLKRLAELEIHSIEQPIAAGQWRTMAELIQRSPLPIALDEELIGVTGRREKTELLDTLKPAHLVLKPTLLGGLAASEEWIELAGDRGVGWWVTSALESNLALGVLAQWVATLGSGCYQGLGTGLLYRDNLPSPLHIQNGRLFYEPEFDWRVYREWID